MKDLIIDIIGNYVTPTYETYSYNGVVTDVIPDGIAGIDIPWVISAFVFLLFFYCVFRVIGGWLR